MVNFNKAYMDAVAMRAIAAGIVVCRASRTPSGRVVLEDEINDEELGTIVSDDLTPQKARILLNNWDSPRPKTESSCNNTFLRCNEDFWR